jgi:UDP-N-acetylmuramoylalanine--D-glutamate ligase
LNSLPYSSAVVIGLGVSGEASAEALLDRGLGVRVVDSADTEGLRERATRLAGMGAEVTLGTRDPSAASGADLVVASPGVPPTDPILEAALEGGAKVISEIELGWLLARGEIPVLAVTGTNGKTTTVSLLAEIMKRGGDAVAAGNIGFPMVRAVAARPDLIVCEVTSFQLAFIDTFHPEVSVMLNVAEDHFDWHAGYDSYLAAKARIIENQGPEDLFVFRAEDPGCLSVASGSKLRLAAFGLATAEEVREQVEVGLARPLELWAGLEDGEIRIGPEGTRVAAVGDIRLTGRHNLENVMAAAVVAMDRGVAVNEIASTVQEFEGLPHRVSVVREVAGVVYIDDSKSTNPHATMHAMQGMERVVLIAGGLAKGLDLSELGDLRSQITGVVVMGEAADELERVFSGVPLHKVRDVEEAVIAASSMAAPGDTVLLSPACSSQDQYSSYEERGKRFAEAVNML